MDGDDGGRIPIVEIVKGRKRLTMRRSDGTTEYWGTFQVPAKVGELWWDDEEVYWDEVTRSCTTVWTEVYVGFTRRVKAPTDEQGLVYIPDC